MLAPAFPRRAVTAPLQSLRRDAVLLCNKDTPHAVFDTDVRGVAWKARNMGHDEADRMLLLAIFIVEALHLRAMVVCNRMFW